MKRMRSKIQLRKNEWKFSYLNRMQIEPMFQSLIVPSCYLYIRCSSLGAMQIFYAVSSNTEELLAIKSIFLYVICMDFRVIKVYGMAGGSFVFWRAFVGCFLLRRSFLHSYMCGVDFIVSFFFVDFVIVFFEKVPHTYCLPLWTTAHSNHQKQSNKKFYMFII